MQLSKSMNNLPVLYSFRRCPYAMRARMALYASQIDVSLREVSLASKPAEMLMASSKATVPVLVTSNNEVLDESLDIMKWALAINDPQGWLTAFSPETILQMDALIIENDSVFKQHLDHYKYAERFPDNSPEYYRQQGEVFLAKLDKCLTEKCLAGECLAEKHHKETNYLFSEQPSLADIAIFPFVRQFAAVDKIWFDQSRYLKLQHWLQRLLDCELFLSVMQKFPVWKSGDKPIIFSANPKMPAKYQLNSSFKS